MLWLSQIAGAITSGRLPAAVSDLGLPTSPVYSLDLAFAVPLIALAGVWLIRRDRRGPAGAAAGLAFLVILGLSVLAIFAFEACSRHRRRSSADRDLRRRHGDGRRSSRGRA